MRARLQELRSSDWEDAARRLIDGKDDAFAGSQELIPEVGCASHLAEGSEGTMEFHRDAVDIEAFTLEVGL